MDNTDRTFCGAIIGACLVGGVGFAIHLARASDGTALFIVLPLGILAIAAIVNVACR